MWKKHPRAQAGQLRERISILVEESTNDGNNQTIRTWKAEIADVPASKEIVAGGETLRGRQLEAGVIAIFTMRTLPFEVTPMMKLRHQQASKDYGIVKVEPADDRGQYLLVQVKASANA